MDDHRSAQETNLDPSRQTPMNILLLSGSSLIVIAIFVLVSAGWGAFSPAGRIATALIPLAILYALGFSTRSNPRQENLSRYTILTGSIIFPFVIGVILYQSGLYATLDSLFYFLVSLASLVWYLFLEFGLGFSDHAVLTIIASLYLANSFAGIIDARDYVYSLLGVILGAFYLNIGLTADRQGQEWQARAYTNVGTVVGWLGAATLPLAYSQGAFNLESSLLYVLVSVALFFLAAFYSREWQDRKSASSYTLRRVAEVTSGLALALPATLAAWGEPGNTLLAILALATGILALSLSGFVRVAAFRWSGYLATATGLITLIFVAYTKVAAVWPIALLVIGFLLIGIAYSFQHYDYHRLFRRFTDQPETSLFGLGMPAEPEKTERTDTEEISSSGGQLIKWIVVVIFFFYLVGLLASY